MKLDPAIASAFRTDAASLKVRESARTDHLAAISRTLASRPVAAPPLWRGLEWQWRRRVAAMTTSALVVGPAGLALASSGALPGEVLYPVKRAVERVAVVFDSEVVARHRLEELSVLLADDAADVTVIIRETEEAVEELGDDHPFRRRLIALLAGDEDPGQPEEDSEDLRSAPKAGDPDERNEQELSRDEPDGKQPGPSDGDADDGDDVEAGDEVDGDEGQDQDAAIGGIVEEDDERNDGEGRHHDDDEGESDHEDDYGGDEDDENDKEDDGEKDDDEEGDDEEDDDEEDDEERSD